MYLTVNGEPKKIEAESTLSKVKDIDVNHTQQKIRKLNKKEVENLKFTLQFMEVADVDPNRFIKFAMSQMSLSIGIKGHGEQGEASALKEINNLVGRDCFREVEYEPLTPRQKKLALPILKFMVEKRDRKLKTRGYADGCHE